MAITSDNPDIRVLPKEGVEIFSVHSQTDTALFVNNLEPISDDILPQITSKGRAGNAMHMAKRTLQGTIIAAEVGPFNEAARYGAFAVAQALSGNVLVGAAAYGGSTLVIESAAALATADLFGAESSNKAFDWINSKLDKFVPKEAKMSKTAEAGIALLGGSVVVMAARQREDTARTIEQNRRYGLFTSTWLAGVCAVQGAAMAEGISHPEPKTIGAALVAVGGALAVAKWAKNKVGSKREKSINTQAEFVALDEVHDE